MMLMNANVYPLFFHSRLAQGTFTFLRPRNLTLRASYQDEQSAFIIQTRLAPILPQLLPPPVTVSFNQRLSTTSLTEGIVTVHVGLQPSVVIALVSPAAFNFTSQRLIPPGAPSDVETSIAGSLSGFGIGTGFTRYAMTLSGLGSNFATERGIKFSELALLVKLGLELGIQGITGMLTGAWHGASGEVSVGVGASAAGVLIRIEYVST
jgi:DnaJ homolog subfamily C member 11